jgi:hypothetical protein
MTLVLGFALRGMALGSHLITNDIAMWWRVVSSLMCALTCCVPLVVETLSMARLYRKVQVSRTVSLDWVQTDDGCRPIGSEDLMVP